MPVPSRYSATRRFFDLKPGDIAYSIDTDGSRVWAVVNKVVAVWAARGAFATLPCYSDGSAMIFFRMWFSRRSGIEKWNHNFEPPTDRPPIRLYLDLPEGVFAVSRPKRGAA